MARTELPNGVILPAEYSDDWYEDMTSNLTKLDDVIGSDSEKLNSNDVAFLRMSSAALTDGGTGNFSDLNSSNKLKTGDYVLDSGRKLYQVVSVDSTNETFTVGNSLFKITAESDLAPVAESGDYDDLDNKPDLNPYDQHIVNTDIHVTTVDKTKWNNNVTQSYVLRYSSASVTDNSTIAYSTLDNTDNIKASDKVIDVDGKIFSVVSVDTTNQTVTVGTALIDLALDANVMHLSGVETVAGIKTFSDIPIFATFDGIRFRCAHNSSAYVTFRNQNQANPGSIIFSANDGNVGTVFHLVNKTLIPYTNGDIDLGTSLRKWKSLNGINPGALSLPDLSNGIDISGYITLNSDSSYTPLSDGYIYICCYSSSACGLWVRDSNNNGVSTRSIGSVPTYNNLVSICIPVVKNVSISIFTPGCENILTAKFYPCQGNV